MRKRKAKKKSESPVRDLDSEIAKVKSELDDAILYEKINQACFEDNRTDETFFLYVVHYTERVRLQEKYDNLLKQKIKYLTF